MEIYCRLLITGAGDLGLIDALSRVFIGDIVVC